MKNLLPLINKYLVLNGATEGKKKLSEACKKSPRMVERYIDGSSLPSGHTYYLLARECGMQPMEALELAVKVCT